MKPASKRKWKQVERFKDHLDSMCRFWHKPSPTYKPIFTDGWVTGLRITNWLDNSIIAEVPFKDITDKNMYELGNSIARYGVQNS